METSFDRARQPPTVRSPSSGDDGESRLPRLDVAERAGLVAAPALLGAAVGLVADVFSGWVGGLVVGGAAGMRLSGVRRRYRAVRTPDGIERRRRPAEDSRWYRAAQAEYDQRWDEVLVVVSLVVGIAGFVAVPVVDASPATRIRLTTVGLGGLVCAAMIYGTLFVDADGESEGSGGNG